MAETFSVIYLGSFVLCLSPLLRVEKTTLGIQGSQTQRMEIKLQRIVERHFHGPYFLRCQEGCVMRLLIGRHLAKQQLFQFVSKITRFQFHAKANQPLQSVKFLCWRCCKWVGRIRESEQK